jgi:hypothetical protein
MKEIILGIVLLGFAAVLWEFFRTLGRADFRNEPLDWDC